MEFLLITGMSGAGKSQAMKVMEDMNYFCMDNLPPALLTKFAELCYESKRAINKVAVVVDIRSGEFFDQTKTSVSFSNDKGTVGVCQDGSDLNFDEEKAKSVLMEKEVKILITLKDGTASGTAWGCDLSYDYVKINAEYTT